MGGYRNVVDIQYACQQCTTNKGRLSRSIITWRVLSGFAEEKYAGVKIY